MIDSKLHKNLVDTFTKTKKNTYEISMLLEALLTQSELHDVALRLEILRRLRRGDTQRDIAESLGVGLATVTRGSRQLKQLQGELDHFLNY